MWVFGAFAWNPIDFDLSMVESRWWYIPFTVLDGLSIFSWSGCLRWCPVDGIHAGIVFRCRWVFDGRRCACHYCRIRIVDRRRRRCPRTTAGRRCTAVTIWIIRSVCAWADTGRSTGYSRWRHHSRGRIINNRLWCLTSYYCVASNNGSTCRTRICSITVRT